MVSAATKHTKGYLNSKRCSFSSSFDFITDSTTQNEKLLPFRILVKSCLSFPELERPTERIKRKHIQSLISSLSISDIKAL